MPKCERIDNIEITSTYGVLKEKLLRNIERERKKYPLSDREEIFLSVINELLEVLDYHTKSSLYK